MALNCVMNAWLRDHGPFANIWTQPAADDAGTALGAAWWIDALVIGSFLIEKGNGFHHPEEALAMASFDDEA